jgi:MFS family permease
MSQFETQTISPEFREKIYRRNFFIFLIDAILFTVAMNVIGGTTVIPDFVRRLTDSEILIGLSGNVFEIGASLPQLFVARYLVGFARKKWWFAGPNIPVRFVVLIFAGLTVWLGPDELGLILAAFFICYGIAAVGDGLVGVPWADLTGTSMDDRWRARMFGLTSASTGLIMLAITPLIALILREAAFPNNYAMLFAISGTLFALSIVPVLFIYELPGGKAAAKVPTFGEFLPELGRMIRTDGQFRAVLAAKLLTTLSAMASAFYIGFATEDLGLSSEVAVPTLLAMQTIGAVTGALLYTQLGARNNLLYIRVALCCGALWPITALLAGVVGPLPLYLGYLVSGLALSNLFFGFQNWIVGYAEPDTRPIYVGLFNTISAVVSLITPIIGGTIVQYLGYRPVFVASLVMILGALFIMVRYVYSTKITQTMEFNLNADTLWDVT